MKFSLQCLSLLGLASLGNAHYGFPYTVVDGVVSKRWEYIRPTTEFGPDWDYSGKSAMCGRNATLPIFPIKTIKVAAGSTIGFGAKGQRSTGMNEDSDFVDFDPKWSIYHPGPATAYMSKAPGELNDYAGDGDWFKIAAIPASDGINWDIRTGENINILNFTIPAATPPGKYLVRAEHLNMVNGNSYKTTEMYVTCAHVEVTGSGTGTPGPLTKFPGAFDAKDPGIWLPAQLFKPIQPMDELKNWQGAGPKVWKG